MLECMDYQHLTKDRPLGSTELSVSDLATPSPAPEDARYPYKSNGIKAFSSPLRQDVGNPLKGTLHYTAEFVPAVALRNVKFESAQDMGVHKLERRAGEHDEDGGVVVDDGDEEDEDGIPNEVTIRSERKRGTPSLKEKESKESVGSAKTGDSKGSAKEVKTGDGNGKVSVKSVEEKGVEMSAEEILAQREFPNTLCIYIQLDHGFCFAESGIAVFHIISGQLHKKGRLEVLLDDGYWPCFTTMKARSTHAQWGYVGEGFIKEIDFSRVWLRLCDSDDLDKAEVLAEWKGDAKTFLEESMVCLWQLCLSCAHLFFLFSFCRRDRGVMS